VNPLKGKMCLPLDCADWQSIEWSEVPAVPRPKRSFADFQKSVEAVAVLPEPIKFKSLGESLNDLVKAVRGLRRPANPLASAFFSSALTKSNSHS
jgi:hypothetical protein